MFSAKAWAERYGAGGQEPERFHPTTAPRWVVLGFLFATAVYLYLILFNLPHTPIYRDGDSDLLLASAKRLFEGEVMYRDFNQVIFPGTEVVYVILFKIFGPVPWIGNFTLMALGLGLTWITLAISRKLIPGWSAFVPALLFLTLIYPSMLDATHHWFSVMAALAAVAVVLEERTPGRLAMAGTLGGLAAWFTHARGLLAVLGIAVFLGWEWQQKKLGRRWLFQGLGWLWASFLVAVVTLNAYFIWRAGLGRFLGSTIIFGLKYYGSEYDNSWAMYLQEFPRLSPWRGLAPFLAGLFVHLVVPYVYLLFQICYRRRAEASPRQPWDGLVLLQAVGLCLFLGVAPAAETQRLATVALPATILLVWILNSWERMGRGILAACVAGALTFAIALPVRMQTRRWIYLDLPAGRVALLDSSRLEVFQWVLGHTKPGEFFFNNVGTYPYVFLAGLRCPGPLLFLTTSDYTRPEMVQQVVEGLEKHHVRFIMWEVSLDVPSGADVAADHLGPLRLYLRTHYRVVKTFAGLSQVWERNDFAAK